MTSNMLDFATMRSQPPALIQAACQLDQAALVRITDQLSNTIKQAIEGASDSAVAFGPRDPHTHGDKPGWTAAHVVTHLTATAEESAAIGATLARGVQVTQRLRYEAPWEELTTVQHIQERLAESARMCRAFLEVWPANPNLDLTYEVGPRYGPLNAAAWHLIGLMHAEGHIEQLREALRQAKSDTEAAT